MPEQGAAPAFPIDRDGARALDAADRLRTFRDEFNFPRERGGRRPVYLCGNSLGLQPRLAVQYVQEELEDWAEFGVAGHFESRRPWMPYHRQATTGLAALCGAQEHEVVAMNSLTVNLHLMMMTFYRPSGRRRKILIESAAFPSDRFAAASQIRLRGFDPADALVEWQPRAGTVRVDGEDPFENQRLTSQICLVGEDRAMTEGERCDQVLGLAATLRPHWDQAYAEHLVERFGLPLRKTPNQLSRGQRSALACVLGLAGRAPLTMFDESYLGMDAPARYAFYEELLSDYSAYPRTIILSTHLVAEFGPLFEEVVILHRGRVLVHDEVDVVRNQGATVTGPADLVDRFAWGVLVDGEPAAVDLGPHTLDRDSLATVQLGTGQHEDSFRQGHRSEDLRDRPEQPRAWPDRVRRTRRRSARSRRATS